MLHLKRWQEGKSTFCKWSLLHFVLEKVISLTIEKANTIGNEYNDKKIKCFQVLCNSILDYHSIQWCKIHDNVCFWEPEIRIWVLHMKRGRNTDEINYYFIFESAHEARRLLAIMCIGFLVNHHLCKHPQGQLVCVYQRFIYNFSNAFPLHPILSSIVWNFQNNFLFSRVNSCENV